MAPLFQMDQDLAISVVCLIGNSFVCLIENLKYAPILLDEEEHDPIGLIGDSYFAFSLGEERDITDNVVDSIVDSCLLLPHSG